MFHFGETADFIRKMSLKSFFVKATGTQDTLYLVDYLHKLGYSIFNHGDGSKILVILAPLGKESLVRSNPLRNSPLDRDDPPWK